jgi:hypothetical protein
MDFPFNARTREVVITLADVLDARVALADAESGRIHRWRGVIRAGSSLEWQTLRGYDLFVDGSKGRCHVTSAVNERWTLIVWKTGFLHASARHLAAWAAPLLARELPERVEGSPYPPGGGGGGGGLGSSELGIPVWWARKIHGAGSSLALR